MFCSNVLHNVSKNIQAAQVFLVVGQVLVSFIFTPVYSVLLCRVFSGLNFLPHIRSKL